MFPKIEYLSRKDEFRTQPILRAGRYYYKELQENHRVEAIKVAAETQLKRLGRLFTFNCCFKYFSRNETEADIYQFSKPPLRSDLPVMHNIGHATLLFQMGNMNILTDPIFGNLGPSTKESITFFWGFFLAGMVVIGACYVAGICSIQRSGVALLGDALSGLGFVALSKMLYPRKTKPGLDSNDLPPIDVVVISHNHRDHCDTESLQKLLPHQPILLVPRGDGAFFENLGFRTVREHEWWSKTTISHRGSVLDFFSVPAFHCSGRGAGDVQESLACSWVFKRHGDQGAIYFRGDTANIPEETMGEIRRFVAAPILANFEPGGPNYRRSWLKSTHQSILDSVLTYFEINEPHERDRSRTYLMHHNAFELGTDRFNEAVMIKDQILSYVENPTEENFRALPEFVQEEFQEGGRAAPYLDRMIGTRRLLHTCGIAFSLQRLGRECRWCLIDLSSR